MTIIEYEARDGKGKVIYMTGLVDSSKRLADILGYPVQDTPNAV